jgi:hypothetical protein
MLKNIVDWMDDNFGHELTDMTIQSTIIGRCTDAAFNHPRLKEFSHLKYPIKIMLSTGFAKEYRHAKWGDIAKNQAYAHVVNNFTPHPLAHLPEAKFAITQTLLSIDKELGN